MSSVVYRAHFFYLRNSPIIIIILYIQKGDSIYIQGNIEEKGIKICQTFS